MVSRRLRWQRQGTLEGNRETLETGIPGVFHMSGCGDRPKCEVEGVVAGRSQRSSLIASLRFLKYDPELKEKSAGRMANVVKATFVLTVKS